MQARLTSDNSVGISHAFFWGHGKTTMALFKSLTGAEKGFLPTAAVMIVALKAESWNEVFAGEASQIEAYAWSPNKSHQVEGGNTPTSSLESLPAPGAGGLESFSFGVSEGVVPMSDQMEGEFEFTVLK